MRSWGRSIKPDRKHFGKDALAGLPGAISSVPDGMASAVLVGVNPVHGLYASFAGPVAGGLTSSTRLMVITTTTAAALAAGSAVSGLDADQRPEALFLLTLLAGLVMVAAGLAHLNKHGQPSRAIFVGFIMNAFLLLFVGSVLGIIFASNVGAFVALTLSLCGFVLLRIDRPNAERPVNVGRLGIPLAVALVIYTLALLVVGFFSPAEAGYGGPTEQIIGLGILLLPLILWAYRRVIQDKLPLSLTTTSRPVVEPETKA
jgi:SulP family sulfate permease